MSRFSHADPRYTAALAEMGQKLRALLDERGWNQADLVRAARIHMPIDAATGKPARLSADNVSNMVTGKRRPTRLFAKAVAAAFGVKESDFMPAFLLAPGGVPEPVAPLLSEVPGKPGVFRVYIDREMDLRQAMKVIACLEANSDSPPTMGNVPVGSAL